MHHTDPSLLTPIALPATTTAELIQQIQTHPDEQIMMVKLDEINDFDPTILNQISQIGRNKTLYIRLRTTDAGGKQILEKGDWRVIMEQILATGFGYVEVEIPRIMDLELNQKHPNTKLVVCYSHPSHTPGYRNLRKLQKRMRGFEPDIQFFDTKIKTKSDLQNLVRLLVSKKKSDNLWINFDNLDINQNTLGNLWG